jgi:hypothetical protein
VSEVGGSVVGVVTVSGGDETGGGGEVHDSGVLGELDAVDRAPADGRHVGAPTVGDDSGVGLDVGAGLAGAPG